MNNTYCSKVEGLFPSAAKLLEERLFSEPPCCDELRALYTFSDEYNEKVLSMSRFIISGKEHRKNLRAIFLVAAIITLFIVFAVCMGAKEGRLFSMNMLNFSRSDGTLNYTELSFDGTVITSTDINRIVFPEYLPESFTRDVSFRSLTNQQKYISGDKFFYFTQSSVYSTSVYNTEKYDIHQVQIGNNIAYYIEVSADSYITISMNCRFGNLSICGNIPLEECIYILESVIFM